MSFLHIVPLIFTLFWIVTEGGEGTDIVCNNGTHVIQVSSECNSTECKLFINIQLYKYCRTGISNVALIRFRIYGRVLGPHVDECLR